MKLPPIKLDHLKTLTDDTGVLQHAKYSTPKRSEGYTTDDNARALIVCIRHHRLHCNHETEKLIDVYLSFLLHMQRLDGKLHNLLSYARRFQDKVGSEDCMGRALWACGYTMNSNLSEEKKRLSKEIFDQGFKWVSNFKSLRSIAKALYDQQPLEAECMVQAATTAFRVTRKEKYHKTAHIAFHWFLGKNSQNLEVYDPKTGGCYDGITPQGVNLNQGAESTICYLLARLELENIRLIETI